MNLKLMETMKVILTWMSQKMRIIYRKNRCLSKGSRIGKKLKEGKQ